MTDDQQQDRNGDGRHDFQAATVSAVRDQMVDDEGHEFTRGRVSKRDEVDEIDESTTA